MKRYAAGAAVAALVVVAVAVRPTARSACSARPSPAPGSCCSSWACTQSGRSWAGRSACCRRSSASGTASPSVCPSHSSARWAPASPPTSSAAAPRRTAAFWVGSPTGAGATSTRRATSAASSRRASHRRLPNRFLPQRAPVASASARSSAGRCSANSQVVATVTLGSGLNAFTMDAARVDPTLLVGGALAALLVLTPVAHRAWRARRA